MGECEGKNDDQIDRIKIMVLTFIYKYFLSAIKENILKEKKVITENGEVTKIQQLTKKKARLFYLHSDLKKKAKENTNTNVI